MKIGVLTLPLHYNYGGILQAYALQTVLQRMGHEPFVISQPEPSILEPRWKIPLLPLHYLKRAVKRYVLKKENAISVFHERAVPLIRRYTQQFVDSYIKKIAFDEVLSLYKNGELEAIVVGSDQIWRPKYYDNISEAYLSFAKDWHIKRIAYAASFGTSEWEYTDTQTALCKELLQKFDAVSVREDSGIELCQKYFSVTARYMPDPTLLLRAEDYIQLFQTAESPYSGGDFFVYILDDSLEKTRAAQAVGSPNGLTPFWVSRPSDVSAPRSVPPVENWLRGFHDAKFVLTDSFHGCVFSILFNKPFLVFGNANRGMARFRSLLRLFALEERLVSSCQEIQDKFVRPVNWLEVNTRLQVLRLQSEQYLRTAIASF